MSNSKSQPKLEQIRAARAALVELSPLQKELHETVTARITRDKASLNEVARIAGVSWGEIKRFLDRESAVGSGLRLKGLCAYAGRSDLEEKIGTLAAPYASTRTLGLALYDVPVIGLAYDVIEQYYGFKNTRMEAFAAAFEEDADAVLGVLEFRKEGFELLKESDRADRIFNRMASMDFTHRVEAAKEAHAGRTKPLLARMFALVEQARVRHGSPRAVAVAMKLPLGVFGTSRCTEMSEERIRELITLLESHVKIPPEDVPAPASGRADAPIPQPPTARPISSNDGADEENLAPPVTSKTFAFIEASDPDVIELGFMLSRLEQVRVMLDKCAQVKDDKVRARIRKKLSRAVEELVLSAKLFTYEFPNRVLTLFDAERANMEALGDVGMTPGESTTQRRDRS